MHPWLIRFSIPGFGLAGIPSWITWVLIGGFFGVLVSVREAKRGGDDPRAMARLAVGLLFFGLVGSRLGHVLFEAPRSYLDDPLKLLRVWEGGMVFYGGFLLAAGLGALAVRRQGQDPLRVLDAMAPGLALGLAFGRLGCFSAGCCYGHPIDYGTGIDLPWGVTFLGGFLPSDLRGIPLHPTQLYSSVAAMLLFLGLGWLRRHQRFDGQVVCALFAVYGVQRSLIELLRLDLDRGFFLPSVLGQAISTSQALSVPLILGGVLGWVILSRRAGRATAS